MSVRALSLTAILTAAIAFSLSPPSPAEDAALTKQFRELLDVEWQYVLRESPTFASHLGDKRYNDRWPDVSLTAIERRHEHAQELLAKLESIDPAKLSPADRLNYLLFKKEIANDLEQFPFHWHLVPLNQREGVQDESQVADGIVFKTVKDYEDWISRLRSFPAYLDQTIELM